MWRDAGCLMMTLHLVAEYLGLAFCPIGGPGTALVRALGTDRLGRCGDVCGWNEDRLPLATWRPIRRRRDALSSQPSVRQVDSKDKKSSSSRPRTALNLFLSAGRTILPLATSMMTLNFFA